MKPTTRGDARAAIEHEHLPAAIHPGSAQADAIVVDQVEDGRIRVYATDERAGIWEGSVSTYAPENESEALDDALRRARTLDGAQKRFRERQDAAIRAWRSSGADAWTRGESGLWLKPSYHSGGGHHWQAYLRQEDFGTSRGLLGSITGTEGAYRAHRAGSPMDHITVYVTRTAAECALIAPVAPASPVTAP